MKIHERSHAMPYVIYLRKSRADMEAEAKGEGETLARHLTQLTELAKKRSLDVGAVYKELVSGETIAARPVMQQLISEVSEGKWDGVICMEIERLARGDTMDQGLVSQAFKFSGTKIVTPAKVYDPNNEFDEEYFEFSLFMSRREYKTIRRRMQAGRLASVKEGNYIGSQPPYGYRKVRNYEDKSYTLEPIEQEADTVRLMYELYTQKNIGYSRIATYLNTLGIPPKRTDVWSSSSVKDIIENPVYCGKLRWNRRKTKKTLTDGKIILSRPKSEGSIFQGKHEPIVSEEVWQAAQEIRIRNAHPSNHFRKTMKNPFVGLMYCGMCGHAMIRRPYPDKPSYYICNHNGCICKSSVETEIDEALQRSLKKHYKSYKIMIENNEQIVGGNNKEILKSITSEIDKLKKQKNRLHDLLEQNVYSTVIFAERSEVLNRHIKDLEEIAAQEQQSEKITVTSEEACVILNIIIDDYLKLEDAVQKNELLKTAIKRINYNKTTGGRHGKSDMKLNIDYLF